MTAPLEPRPEPGDPNFGMYRGAPPPDDLSIVPGLGEGRTRPLDPSKDPDRFDPSAPPEVPKGLDPTYDPDRFRAPGQGQSLTDLLGEERSFSDKFDGYEWAFGLLAVLTFLALVAFFFGSVLNP